MKKKEIEEIFYYFSLVTQLGIVVASSIVGGAFLGNFIDKKVGTKGIFLALFIIVGIVAGLLCSYKLLMHKWKE